MVAYEILETAQSPKSPFPFWIWGWDLGLGLGTGTWDSGLSISKYSQWKYSQNKSSKSLKVQGTKHTCITVASIALEVCVSLLNDSVIGSFIVNIIEVFEVPWVILLEEKVLSALISREGYSNRKCLSK